MELVNLFKELIKRGWKVYGEYDELMSYGQTRGKRDFGFGVLGEIKYSLRELVSKESGLWQFVCKNKMQKERPPYNRDSDTYGFTIQEYQYRIIESALCNENKLEQFLLENIKI